MSEDGYGEAWSPYSLSYQHNLGVARGANVPAFNAAVNLSNTTGTGPRQTNAYTSLVRLDERRAMVLYGPSCPKSASRSLRRALSIPRPRVTSLYRCGKRT